MMPSNAVLESRNDRVRAFTDYFHTLEIELFYIILLAVIGSVVQINV